MLLENGNTNMDHYFEKLSQNAEEKRLIETKQWEEMADMEYREKGANLGVTNMLEEKARQNLTEAIINFWQWELSWIEDLCP